MNKREEKIIIYRGEDWGLWKDQGAERLGYSKQSPIARLQQLGVRVESEYYDLAPEYSHSEYNKRTDLIIHSMPITLKDIAYYSWVGINKESRGDKKQELTLIIKRHNWGKYKNGEWIPDLNKFYAAKKDMHKYLYAAIRSGAYSKLVD